MQISLGRMGIVASSSTGWCISTQQTSTVVCLDWLCWHSWTSLSSCVLLSFGASKRQNVPRDEIVLAAMPLSAELRLTTPLRVAIHPQFEACSLKKCASVAAVVTLRSAIDHSGTTSA